MFLLHAVAQLARERECCDESGNKDNRLPASITFTECSNVTSIIILCTFNHFVTVCGKGHQLGYVMFY